MRKKYRRRRIRNRTEKEEEDLREELKIIAYILFRLACIAAIVLLCKYCWQKYKPATVLYPNDWDLPIYIEVVKK